MVWIFISIILCMRVVQSVFNKKNSNALPKNAIGYLKYVLLYMSIACALATSLFAINMAVSDAKLDFVVQTALYASITGISLATTCICSLYNLSNGTMALNSLFSTAGLLIPTVASIFLYGETLEIWHWAAIVIFMVGAFLLVGSSKAIYGNFSIKSLASLVIMLVSEGCTMLMQKSFGMNFPGGNVSLFSACLFASGAVILSLALGALCIAYKVKGGAQASNNGGFTLLPASMGDAKLDKKIYVYAFLLAGAVFVINQLATKSTPLISAVVLFAFINGGATIISTLVGATLFKEKISARSAIGLVLGIGSLILLQI